MKADLLRRTAEILAKLRRIRSNSNALGEAITEIENELAAMEADLAEQIDKYMAAKYDGHNYPRERKEREYEASTENRDSPVLVYDHESGLGTAR